MPDAKPRVEHRTASANDVRLHYLIAGSGDPVILLHGWPLSAEMWRPVMAELAKTHTVIAPDLRGAGYSEKPAGGYDKVTLSDDIHALATDLGFDRYAVVGYDIGGMVAYPLAARQRAAVEKLVVVDVPLPGIEPWDRMQGAPALWHFAFHAQRDLAEALIRGRERLYIETFIRDRAFDPAAIPDADIDRYAAMMAAPGCLRGGLEYYRTFAQDAEANKKLAADKLAIPALGIGGDRLGPVLEGIMAAIAQDGRAVTIENCGHWVVAERTDAFLQELTGFLG
jgi:pimeloyl-ACP methyl ester carboxylesterase